MKLTYLYITDARPFTEGILDKCMWIALEKFTGLHEAEYFQDKDAVTRWAQDFLRLYCDIVICQMAKRGPSQLNPRGGGGPGRSKMDERRLGGLLRHVIDAWPFDVRLDKNNFRPVCSWISLSHLANEQPSPNGGRTRPLVESHQDHIRHPLHSREPSHLQES